MELKLTKKWARMAVCLLLRRAIRKLFGIKVKFTIPDKDIPSIESDENGYTHFTISINAVAKDSDLEKVIYNYND